MLSAALMTLLSSAYITLRLTGSGSSFPRPLSAEEEKKYLDLLAQGDEEARGKLIEHNLRLVAHIIKKYYTQSFDQDDLISIGTIGLIKGISTYKSDKGVRLATYASRCIENEILMYFRSQKKTSGDVSLSDSIDSDSEGNSLSLMDVICVDDDMLERINAREIVQSLHSLIDSCLTQREADIVASRYGLFGRTALTQREIAVRCGISRSYVSRIEKKALEKLRRNFEAASVV